MINRFASPETRKCMLHWEDYILVSNKIKEESGKQIM